MICPGLMLALILMVLNDPGLGKTITVLSLILQTIGLTSTTTSHETMSSAEETLTKTRTDEIFDAYWSERMNTTPSHTPKLLDWSRVYRTRVAITLDRWIDSVKQFPKRFVRRHVFCDSPFQHYQRR